MMRGGGGNPSLFFLPPPASKAQVPKKNDERGGGGGGGVAKSNSETELVDHWKYFLNFHDDKHCTCTLNCFATSLIILHFGLRLFIIEHTNYTYTSFTFFPFHQHLVPLQPSCHHTSQSNKLNNLKFLETGCIPRSELSIP